MVQRGPGQFGAGKWCFPCGYVEWGEDVRDAAAREAREEAGVDGGDRRGGPRRDEPPRAGEAHRRHLVRGALVDPSAEPRAGDDAVAVGWFDPASPPPIAFPTDAPVLARLS